jgi:hypothetical protein
MNNKPDFKEKSTEQEDMEYLKKQQQEGKSIKQNISNPVRRGGPVGPMLRKNLRTWGRLCRGLYAISAETSIL